MLRNILITLYYPADGYERLRRKMPYGQACILYVCICVMTVLQVLFTHQPLALVRPDEANLFFEICKVMVPLLTFVLVSYGMSTFNDGEAKLGAVFIGTAFSMLPYLLMTPVLITLSRILSASDAAIYYGLSALVWAWVCFQFYRQVNILNNYTLPQTVGLIVLTLCGMLALWALLVLLYFLSRNLFQFVQEIWMEIYLLFN